MRGKFEGCPVILASATPAIETRQQVALGSYAELRLPGRYGAAELPTIEAIDLIAEPPERGRWIAPRLVRRDRRDARAPRTGAAVPQPPRLRPADAVPDLRPPLPMPELHRLDGRAPAGRAACPATIAGTSSRPRASARSARTRIRLVACGPGVERIADEVRALFPDAQTAIVTSDTIWSPAKAAEFVNRMEEHEIDIVVGTQLVTKGYHFPNLTLVGVIDADLGLGGGDLRAAERTFQQIRQVSGRAGRGEKPGHVYIQTHSPDGAGHAGAGHRRRRRILRSRDGSPPRRARPALRPLRRDRRIVGGPGLPPTTPPVPSPAPRRAWTAWKSTAPPPRRSACCAAATVSACWSTPAARWTCRTSSATGSAAWNGRARSASSVDVDPYNFL